jgi:AraC-like DNA-binding protein
MRPPDKNIDKALEYLCERIDSPMSCEEIANICGCDPAVIKRVFYSGMSKLCRKDLSDIKELWDEMRDEY